MTNKANSETVETVLDPSRALAPVTVQINEERVRKGFWPKIRRTAARIPFAGQALASWYAARDPETPTAAKGMFLAGLAYFVMPIDAIPDIFAGIGFTDDAAVFAALITLLGSNIKARHHDQALETMRRLRERR